MYLKKGWLNVENVREIWLEWKEKYKNDFKCKDNRKDSDKWVFCKHLKKNMFITIVNNFLEKFKKFVIFLVIIVIIWKQY